MGGEQTAPTGPDLAQGMALSDVPDGGMLAGHVGEEAGLGVGVKHEVAVAEVDGGEGGEDAAAGAEIDGAHMGAFGGIGEREGDAAEVFGGHGNFCGVG